MFRKNEIFTSITTVFIHLHFKNKLFLVLINSGEDKHPV